MAVTVVRRRFSNGTVAQRDTYAKGQFFTLVDGHLEVYVATNVRVGIYAPGQWESAYTDQEMVPSAGAERSGPA